MTATSPPDPPDETVEAPGAPAADAHADAGPGRHEKPSHHRVSSALIGALLALLGFALAIQLRTSDDDGFVGARQEDLVRILDDQNNRQDRLRDQIADLEDAQRRLEGGADATAAGAEAIQIGDVRIGVTTSFQDSVDGAVAADGVRLSRPYVILAIGAPGTMDTALNIPGGVGATARAAGGSLSVVQQERVEITAVRAAAPPKYASPAPS